MEPQGRRRRWALELWESPCLVQGIGYTGASVRSQDMSEGYPWREKAQTGIPSQHRPVRNGNWSSGSSASAETSRGF